MAVPQTADDGAWVIEKPPGEALAGLVRSCATAAGEATTWMGTLWGVGAWLAYSLEKTMNDLSKSYVRES